MRDKLVSVMSVRDVSVRDVSVRDKSGYHPSDGGRSTNSPPLSSGVVLVLVGGVVVEVSEVVSVVSRML